MKDEKGKGFLDIILLKRHVLFRGNNVFLRDKLVKCRCRLTELHLLEAVYCMKELGGR